MQSPPIFACYLSNILDDTVDVFGLCHLEITEYCVLAFKCSVVVVCDNAAGYECVDSRLHLSCKGMLVSIPGRLRTPVHDYRFQHLIESSASTMRQFMWQFEVQQRYIGRHVKVMNVRLVTCSISVRQ